MLNFQPQTRRVQEYVFPNSTLHADFRPAAEQGWKTVEMRVEAGPYYTKVTVVQEAETLLQFCGRFLGIAAVASVEAKARLEEEKTR